MSWHASNLSGAFARLQQVMEGLQVPDKDFREGIPPGDALELFLPGTDSSDSSHSSEV